MGRLRICGGFVLGITVDKFNAHLLREGDFNLLAVRSGQLSHALLNRLNGILNSGLADTLLLIDDLASHTGDGDGLVDAGLDRLGVTDANRDIYWVDVRNIVGGLLGNLFAVLALMTVTAISLITGLTNGDHLNVGLLHKSDFDGFGSGVFVFLVVRVRANFVGNVLRRFGAFCSHKVVTVFTVNDPLDGNLFVSASRLKGWSTHLGIFGHILNGAVVFGFLIAVMGSGSVTVGRRLVTVRLSQLIRVGRVRVARLWQS